MIKAHHILLKDAVNTPTKLVCLRSPLNPHIHLNQIHLITMIAPVALVIYVSVQVLHMYLTMILCALETGTWRGKKEVIVKGMWNRKKKPSMLIPEVRGNGVPQMTPRYPAVIKQLPS
jgi:hypothetical protein